MDKSDQKLLSSALIHQRSAARWRIIAAAAFLGLFALLLLKACGSDPMPVEVVEDVEDGNVLRLTSAACQASGLSAHLVSASDTHVLVEVAATSKGSDQPCQSGATLDLPGGVQDRVVIDANSGRVVPAFQSDGDG